MVSYSRSFKDHHNILCGTRSFERTSLLRFREKLEKAKLKLKAWHLVATVRLIWKSSFPCVCNCWCPFRVSGMQMMHQGFYDSLQGDMVQSIFTCQMYRYAPSNTDVENSAPHKLWSLPTLRPSANQHLLKAPLKQESSPIWDFHTCEALWLLHLTGFKSQVHPFPNYHLDLVQSHRKTAKLCNGCKRL